MGWLIVLLAAGVLATPAGATQTPVPATLRVGTSGDYAPFSLHDTAGRLTGFDVVVAERLAADLGQRLELLPFRWPELTDRMRGDGLDLVMSGVTLRPDRALVMSFSRPYATSGAVAVIRRRDRRRFRRTADLDRRGVRIAVNAGGHLEHVARQRFRRARLLPVSDNTTLPHRLLAGTVDAVISDAVEARTWPPDQLATLPPFTHDWKVYAVRRDGRDLLKQVDDWLAAREADGWLNALRRRWLGEQASATPRQTACAALVAAMDLRLQLMPYVAAVKRREHLPIEDPAQEARVLDRARAAAAAAGLQPDGVAALFTVQMAAAKAVEHAAPTSDAANVSLADVRVAVGAASDQIIAELVRCRPWLEAPGHDPELDAAVGPALRAPGVSAHLRTALRTAIRRVRPATPPR